MSYHCPTCKRIIFNRRLERCEFCGTDLPTGLRLSPKEVAQLDKEMANLSERRKKRDLEQEEERKKEIQERPKKGFLPGPRDISEMVAKWRSDDAT